MSNVVDLIEQDHREVEQMFATFKDSHDRSLAIEICDELDKHTKALRKWRDKEYYDEWRFVAGDADNDVMQDPANKPPVFIPTPRR